MKIWVMLGDGFEELEALAVVDIARRAGIETLMVSLMDRNQVKSARDIWVICDKMFEEIAVERDDCIVIPGGKGIQVLNESEGLKEILKAHRRHNGWMAAICAGPMLPGGLGLLTGIRATCFPGYEQYLKGAVVVADDVVTDQNCITAKGAGVSLAFGYAIVAALKGQVEADQLKTVMQYSVQND